MADPCKLHVGNLSYNATEEDLRDKFEKFGAIEEVIVIMDRETCRCRGFGFVTFAKAEDAKAAIKGLNGDEICDREIRVSEARQRNDSSRGRGYGDRRGGGGYSGRGYSGGGNRYGGGGGNYQNRSYGGSGGGRSGGSDRSYGSDQW